MSGSTRASRPRRKVLLKDVNPSLMCSQCSGYIIDATTLVDCLHTFCRACILKHLESSGKFCPTCNMDYKKRSYSILRPDDQLQTLIFKMVGGLYSKEKNRRQEFYNCTNVRASSSCSDDSVLEDIPNQEDWTPLSTTTDFFSPDDSISLSLEYYKSQLDKSATKTIDSNLKTSCSSINNNASSRDNSVSDNKHKCNRDNVEGERIIANDVSADRTRDRRFLQCPAAVEMLHLQKFVRMKYGLSSEHKVDIIYEGEVLPQHFTLMDVAYSFQWTRVKPMRFFYRIFTHTKVQPIRIINTASTGAKQLQVVPSETIIKTPEIVTISPPPKQVVQSEISTKKDDTQTKSDVPTTTESKPMSPELPPSLYDQSRSYTSQERLMAHLQLQPNRDSNGRRLVELPKKTPTPERTFVHEYEEPDKEEIKRFAEKRDREWKMLVEKEQVNQQHVNKKRKKSKHSKSDVTHKKRKLHAEITPSNEKQESIKLKLKVTQVNGHKHKHRSGSVFVEDTPQQQGAAKLAVETNKQELLKLRGVRHKNIIQIEEKPSKTIEEPKRLSKLSEDSNKDSKKPVVALEKAIVTVQKAEVTSKLRSDFSFTKPTKDEEKQTFLKTFQPDTKERCKPPAEKVASAATNEKTNSQNKVNNSLNKTSTVTTNNNSNSVVNNQKLMERKIAQLKQECSVEGKRNQLVKPDKRVSFDNPIVLAEKLKASQLPDKANNQFTTNPGFTVSKIDNTGVKRKLERPAGISDHRPSLEITMVPQKPVVTAQKQAGVTTGVVKRPIPETIPLERIMKSNAAAMSKAGLSITPKPFLEASSAHVSAGVLDLSQKLTTIELTNGLKPPQPPQSADSHKGLSNLQMLSKVATEQSLSKPPKLIRPQLPNLHNLNVYQPKPMPNLTKIPKLNELNLGQFRSSNNGGLVRTMVRPPIQNQSIRNIPNPSLLVRQQHQNRLNSLTNIQGNADKGKMVNNGFKEVVASKSGSGGNGIEGKDKSDSKS